MRLRRSRKQDGAPQDRRVGRARGAGSQPAPVGDEVEARRGEFKRGQIRGSEADYRSAQSYERSSHNPRSRDDHARARPARRTIRCEPCYGSAAHPAQREDRRLEPVGHLTRRNQCPNAHSISWWPSRSSRPPSRSWRSPSPPPGQWATAEPALYRAVRIGEGGRAFEVLKLRTMRFGGDGPRVTGRDDPRITPIGRVLRRLKVDELPQLINVMRGEMSIVGPRPEDPSYVDWADPQHNEVFRLCRGLPEFRSCDMPARTSSLWVPMSS